ncbi:MAG: PAS domain S-box protein [Bacteroidales bacterium]|nr:PAS domain S-box protein [Bacteroidales bacterium]
MVLNPILKFFRDLETFNQDPEFIRYRESNLRSTFTLVTVLGITTLMLFHVIDLIMGTEDPVALMQVRIFTSAALLVNLLLSLGTRYHYLRKVYTCIGFYLGMAASAMISHYADPQETRYWIGPALLLLVWFAFIPFRFSRQVLHGFFFLILYSGLIWILAPAPVDPLHLAGTNLFLLGFFILGVILAFTNNQSSATIFSARKAARTSDDRYRILTEHMQDVVWTLDLRTRKFSFISPSVEKLRGFTSDEVMRMPFEASFTPPSAERVSLLLGEVVREFQAGKDFTSFAVGELEQYCRDGSTVWIEVAATLITDEKGELAEMLGVSRNITARRKAEQALRESEEKYRTLISQANDGIFITQDEVFRFVNQAFCDITEYTASELIGRPFIDLIAPEEIAHLTDIHRRRMAGEKVPDIYSTIGVSKSGRRVNLEFNGSTIEFEGRPASFVIMRDNTEQMKSAALISESEEKYRSLVERANDGIVILQDGKVRFINQMMARILGYSVDEILDTPFVNFIAPDEREKILAIYRKRQAGEQVPQIYESVLIRKDGTFRPVEFNNGIITYNGAIATQTYIRDITERKAAEQALVESEQRYALAVEGVNEGIFDWNLVTNEVYFSNNYKAIMGLTPDEMKNDLSEWDVRIHPDDREMVLRANSDFISGKSPVYNPEYRLLHRSGEYRWILARGVCLRDESGKAYRMAGSHMDITERRQSEERLRESEARYRSIFDTAADAIFLIDKESGSIADVNQPATRIYGFSKEELLRMNVQQLADEPDETIEILDATNRFHFVPLRKSVRKDGQVVMVEISASYFEMAGKPYVIAMVHDITLRKKAEEALRESETKFREITDLLPQLIYELDNRGVITFLNRTGKEMFGITEAQIRKGLQAAALVVPEQRERLMRNFTEIMNLRYSDIENEFLGLRSDGSRFPILVYGSAVLRDGNVTGNRGVVIDITDRKNTEEELRRVNERLTLHFRQTPLAYIEWNEKLEVTDWNPAAESIFGYTREEVLGKHAFNLIVPPHIHDEIARLSENILNQAGGQRNTNENITRSGHAIICNWYNTPLKDTTGKVIGLASLVQDITEQKKLEAELERYVTVLEKNYSESKIKVQSYSLELETRKNELLQLQKENLQSQFETLRSQVNPHFLFNSLNVLTSLIKIEPDLAEQFTIRLSMVYRYVLENKDKDLVSLETELDFLKAYTFLLDIRFSGKMKVIVDLPEEKLQLKVVPLALQLLIENAIKHNTFSKKQPLQVDIYHVLDYLVIENNLQVRESHVQSTGVGLNNIASRYAYFTDRKTVAGVEGEKFVVKIPLL